MRVCLVLLVACGGAPPPVQTDPEPLLQLQELRVMAADQVLLSIDGEGQVLAAGEAVGSVDGAGLFVDASGTEIQLLRDGRLRGPQGIVEGWSVGTRSAQMGERLLSIDERGRIEANGERVTVVGAEDADGRRLALYVFVARGAVTLVNGVEDEAVMILEAVFRGLSLYVGSERVAPDGTIVHQLPVSAPRTPPGIPCASERRMWRSDARTWRDIGIAPTDPLYNSYEVETNVEAGTFVARAFGDRDCDGELTIIELHGRITEGGLVRDPELRRIAPTE